MPAQILAFPGRKLQTCRIACYVHEELWKLEWLKTENEGLDSEESSWILATRILPLIQPGFGRFATINQLRSTVKSRRMLRMLSLAEWPSSTDALGKVAHVQFNLTAAFSTSIACPRACMAIG